MELMRSRAARAGTLLCALALAACGDRGDPVSVTQPPASGGGGAVLASMECRVSVAAHTVACGEAALPAAVRGYVVVGGQNQLVKLTSSNIAYDTAGNHAFEFDVTVQNLIPQALATTDGTTADPNGVRVFFAQEPTVATGSGSASVSNADGVGTFTAAAQSFYQYVGTQLGADGILSNTETSSAKHWIFNVDPTVTTFTFKVYVAAEVRFPNGYVDVSTAPFVLAGGSQTITGITRSFAGTPTNQPITWGTSNPAVATVDAAGNITAVAPGTAQITATAGSVSGTATIGVCPNLSVGGVYTATMPGAANVCLGGGAGGAAEYTYMPINLSTSGALSLTLTASGIQAVTGPPSPNLLPGTSARLGLSGAMSTSFDQVVDGGDVAILEKDAGKIGALMGSRSSRIAAGQTGNAARYYRTGSGSRRVLTAGTPAVGTLMDLNTNSSCSGTASVRTGMVRSVSPHMIIVADTMNPAGGFTTAQYDSIALEFDSIAWPVDTANFGAITDEDGNGHVVAFFTRAVNELSPPASSQVTLGFFASKDLFSNDPSTGCTNSNMGEMFYMLVPDPSGAVNSNVRTVSSFRTGSFNSVGTMGHEFQHMINAFRRAYVTNASALEVGWLNEGLSHIAEELMFYRMSKGLAPKQNLPLSSLNTGPNASARVAAFNAYANPNYGRFKSWLQRPDTTGAFKSNGANSLAVRGAIWSFLRYASDRANAGDQTFFNALVNNDFTGKANIQNAIGGANPDLWLRDWTTAMYADDNAFSVSAEYTTQSWNFRSVYGGLGGFPLGTRALSNNVPLTLSYSTGGATAYARMGVPQSAFATVTALGSGSTIPTSPYSLAIVRTK